MVGIKHLKEKSLERADKFAAFNPFKHQTNISVLPSTAKENKVNLNIIGRSQNGACETSSNLLGNTYCRWTARAQSDIIKRRINMKQQH